MAEQALAEEAAEKARIEAAFRGMCIVEYDLYVDEYVFICMYVRAWHTWTHIWSLVNKFPLFKQMLCLKL